MDSFYTSLAAATNRVSTHRMVVVKVLIHMGSWYISVTLHVSSVIQTL